MCVFPRWLISGLFRIVNLYRLPCVTILPLGYEILDMIRYKDRHIQGELSNVLLFWEQRREAPGTGSPSFPISSTKMPVIVSEVSPKLMLLYVWNFALSWPHLFSFQHHRFEQNWFHQLGLMRVLPTWLLLGLFIIENLYSWHMSLFHHQHLKLLPNTVHFFPYL